MIKPSNKHKLSLFILFFLIFCSACNHVNEKRFLFEAELSAVHRFPLHDVFSSLGMHIHNDYLILSQMFNPYSPVDYFFHAYRLSDFTYIGSFGPRGRGPGEWLNPQVVRTSNTSSYLYLEDVYSRQSTAVIHKMALDSLGRLTEIGCFSVDKGYIAMNRPVIRNDSLLVFDEFSGVNGAHWVFHLQEERPAISQEWMNNPNPVTIDENMGSLMANDSCIVYVYMFKKMIDIRDWNLNLKRRLNYQKGKPIIQDQLSTKRYYFLSFLGEHFLYAFYSELGMSFEEHRSKSNMSLALEVFDTNGTPVFRYIFSEPTPESFAVDERTFFLYGFRASGGMEDSISVYHLSGLKEYVQNRK